MIASFHLGIGAVARGVENVVSVRVGEMVFAVPDIARVVQYGRERDENPLFSGVPEHGVSRKRDAFVQVYILTVVLPVHCIDAVDYLVDLPGARVRVAEQRVDGDAEEMRQPWEHVDVGIAGRVLPFADSLRGYCQLLRQLFLRQIPIPAQLCDGLSHVFIHFGNPPSCGLATV